MSYKRGDIVLVPFPFTDNSNTKKRPAVILSTDRFFNARGDYVVVALTSQPPDNEYEFCLKDWQEEGLLKPTTVKTGKYLTVHPKQIIKKIGKLTERDMLKLIDKNILVFHN